MNAAEVITVQDYKHKKLMWMEVQIYSVKTNSQACNIQVKYVMAIWKCQSGKILS